MFRNENPLLRVGWSPRNNPDERKTLARAHDAAGRGRVDLGPLLKVPVYAYLSNIYSSCRMEAALCENIHFMWLSGMAKVSIETGPLATAMNLKKMAKAMAEQARKAINEALHGLGDRFHVMMGPSTTPIDPFIVA